MKVLHINPSMPGGGIESMICGLANEMAKTQDVTVCSIFEPKSTDVFCWKLNSKVSKVSLGKVNKGFSLKEILMVYKFIKQHGFDIVYLHGFIQYYILAVVLLHKKVQFCYTLHTDAKMENTGWSGRLYKFKKFCFVHKWIKPITISYASQKSFYDLYKCESNLIFNGIPRPILEDKKEETIQRYRYTSQTKVFLHPGRITLAKNQVVLCEVFKQLIDDGEDVVLLIAGPKDDDLIYGDLEKYWSDRIVYLGQRDDVPMLLKDVDAMCLPSIWEGLPVTLLEALSVGCIPICAPVGGIVDVVQDGKNGLLSLSSDAFSFYESMKKFLSMNDAERIEMKNNSQKSFDKFDVKLCASQYISLYKD